MVARRNDLGDTGWLRQQNRDTETLSCYVHPLPTLYLLLPTLYPLPSSTYPLPSTLYPLYPLLNLKLTDILL